MKFSVIVPTYNREKLLTKCLDSLINQKYPANQYEIIVIDDGSTKENYKVVENFKKKFPNMHYFKIKNSGSSVARNLGLQKAKGQFLTFTDDDCVVEERWLKKIEEAFEKTNADAIGGSVINPTNSYIAWANYLLKFSSLLPKGKINFTKDIITANASYKHKAIENTKFPEYIKVASYEDSLFNFSLYKKGKKILFCPHIIVKHHTWDNNYGLKKFFRIQKKSAIGFISGGYKVHGKSGKLLMKIKILNLLCPGFIYSFKKSLKSGYLLRFIYCFPLIFIGDLYKGILVLLNKKK